MRTLSLDELTYISGGSTGVDLGLVLTIGTTVGICTYYAPIIAFGACTTVGTLTGALAGSQINKHVGTSFGVGLGLFVGWTIGAEIMTNPSTPFVAGALTMLVTGLLL